MIILHKSDIKLIQVIHIYLVIFILFQLIPLGKYFQTSFKCLINQQLLIYHQQPSINLMFRRKDSF